jgi:hypothetical protein
MGNERARMTDDTDQDIVEVKNGGLSVKDVTHQPMWLRWLLYTTVVAILLTGLYIVGRIMPFEPLVVDDVMIYPEESCGGYEAYVTYVGRADGGLYSLGKIEGFAYWMSGEDPRPYSSIYFTVEDLEPFETREFEGPTRRTAPWPEDEWHAGVDAVVYGKRFGFVPVEQRVHIESDDSLTTLNRFSDECSNEQRDQ